MKRLTKRARTLIGACLAIVFSTASSQGADPAQSRIIVRLRPNPSVQTPIVKGASGRAKFDRVIEQFKVETLDQLLAPVHTPPRGRALAQRLRLHDYIVLAVPPGADPEALRVSLEQSPDVELAEFDGIVRAFGSSVSPNDPYFSTRQYALLNTGTQPPNDPGTSDADIDMDEGWQYTTGNSSVILAIIDTGIDFIHPEFVDRLWLNADEEADNEIDDDGNGKVDDYIGWNFVANTNSPADGHGHGTHVAGIAAATGNNGVGIAGMDWNCHIMVLKALDDNGAGQFSWLAAAVTYAANEGADVISMSLGADTTVAEMDAALEYAKSLGVVVVAAMGNDDVGTPHWPAAHDGVISVGATDSDDRRADPFCYSPSSGSNYGSWIDVCAPGENVWSTYLVAQNSYANLCGTSMATPHVSGLVSLMLALRPGWALDSILNILTHTSDDEVGLPAEDTPGFDIYHGWGRINAEHALRVLSVNYPPVISVPESAATTEAETLSVLITAEDSNFSSLAFSASTIPNAALVDNEDGTMSFVFMPDYSQVGEYSVEFTVSDGAISDTATTVITVANGCQCPCPADPACDSVTDISDVVSTIGVAFRGNTQITDPDCFPNPGGRTDVNCSGATDVVDVVSMIDVAFRGQAASFCNPCDL